MSMSFHVEIHEQRYSRPLNSRNVISLSISSSHTLMGINIDDSRWDVVNKKLRAVKTPRLDKRGYANPLMAKEPGTNPRCWVGEKVISMVDQS